MTFNPPPAILQKVMRFKALKYEDGGKLTLWNVPCVLFPSFSWALMHQVFYKEVGFEKTKEIMYSLGYTQAFQAISLVNKTFGYAETIKNKLELLKFNTGQIDNAGQGHFEWTRCDETSKIFIMKGNSTLSEEYLKLFGKTKEPMDDFKRGEAAACMKLIYNIDVTVEETKCIAKGDQYCEFVCKETKNPTKVIGLDQIDLKKTIR